MSKLKRMKKDKSWLEECIRKMQKENSEKDKEVAQRDTGQMGVRG
jgi:hypothetical protein